jgi:hypothetical protein
MELDISNNPFGTHTIHPLGNNSAIENTEDLSECKNLEILNISDTRLTSNC